MGINGGDRKRIGELHKCELRSVSTASKHKSEAHELGFQWVTKSLFHTVK